MNITIVTAYFYPEITAATHLLWDLANDLAEQGANVTVVTNIPTRGIDSNLTTNYMQQPEEIINSNLRIIRVGTAKKENNNFLRRALRYFNSSISLYKKANYVPSDIYFISSTPPFLGLTSIFLKRKAPVIYNLQDIFPDSLINAGKIKENSILLKGLHVLESIIYKNQQHIITISKDFKNTLIRRGVNEDKVTIIYNWIDENKVIPIEKENNVLLERFQLSHEKFYITYCGNIGYSQNLELIVDIAADLEEEYPDIHFVFIGDGAWKSNLEAYIKLKKVNSISLFPFQPYNDISYVMSLGDVSLVCSKANVGSSSFPSKTWSIMSAGRPVVCSFDPDSELCEIISNAECGLCVPPENKDKLQKSLLELYQNSSERLDMGERGRDYIINNLTRQYATKKYFNIIKAVSNL